MRIIRAVRDLHIPNDPENPNVNSFRAIQRGIVALVPDNFQLPDGTYQDLGNFKPEKIRLGKKKDA